MPTDGLRLSVMRGSSLDQLQEAEAPSLRRGHSPALGAPRRDVRPLLPSEAPSMRSVLSRLKPGLRLLGVGSAIMMVDAIYTAQSGESFTLGPARALWVAGPLVGLGLVRLVLSLHG
jgi:hypothetical protein